jgi:hypothetical protein
MCKIIQARKEGSIKYDESWREKIEDELNEVRDNVKHIESKVDTIGTSVAHIKKVINHVDK